MKEKKPMPKSIWIADNTIISASNQSMEGKERRQSGIVQHVSYSSRLVSSDMQQTVCFLFNFLLLFGSCLLVCICILFLQSFTPLFSNYRSARFCTSILQAGWQQCVHDLWANVCLLLFYLDLQFGLRNGTPPWWEKHQTIHRTTHGPKTTIKRCY